jgi:putative membrane protein
MPGFILRAVISALGLWLAAESLDGLHISTPLTLVIAAVLLGVFNAFLRPLAIILTLPMTLVTLGLFILVINAAMLGLVALLLPGFSIEGFWAAFFGALIVGITSWVASWFIGPRGYIDIVQRGKS